MPIYNNMKENQDFDTVEQPMDDRIVFISEAVQTEQKSAGGIIMVQKEEAIPYGQATALKVGLGRITNGGLIPLAINEGDRFLYNIQAATTFRLGGIDYSQVRQSDIITTIRSSKEEVKVRAKLNKNAVMPN